MSDDAVETSWLDAEVLGVPSDPLPSDPDWAGKTVFVDARDRASRRHRRRQLWRVIEGIGGENGWYSSPLLWAIRGWMDRLVGGIGLARGRRSRARLEVGDALDFWRVEAIERGSFLRLRAEMKVPGLAWLELRASREGDGSRYDQRAVFFPQGLAGRLYWLAVLPFHGFIFRGHGESHRGRGGGSAGGRGPGRSGTDRGDGQLPAIRPRGSARCGRRDRRARSTCEISTTA